MNNYKINWYIRPSDIKNIFWNDINRDPEETVNFENDGDGISKYIWARRKKDNKFVRVGKVIKNYIFLPFIYMTVNILTGLSFIYNFMNDNGEIIILGCSYCILLLFFSFYCFNGKKEPLEAWM